LKIDGRNPCWYCWINWIAKKSMRYSTGKIFWDLKRGSVLCRWFRFAQLAKGKKFRP
jgi:hypothetical protein